MGAVASHSHILSKHQQKNINMHENAVNHDDLSNHDDPDDHDDPDLYDESSRECKNMLEFSRKAC